VANSGWIAGTSQEFTGLTDGQIYYYRVKARDVALNESGWSASESSTQDDTAPTSSADPLAAYQSTLTFDVASDREDYAAGSNGSFTVQLWNAGDAAENVTVRWRFPHNYWTTGDPLYTDRARTEGGQVAHDVAEIGRGVNDALQQALRLLRGIARAFTRDSREKRYVPHVTDEGTIGVKMKGAILRGFVRRAVFGSLQVARSIRPAALGMKCMPTLAGGIDEQRIVLLGKPPTRA